MFTQVHATLSKLRWAMANLLSPRHVSRSLDHNNQVDNITFNFTFMPFLWMQKLHSSFRVPPMCAKPWWLVVEGHFSHETESPWPLHFKHSHWWKRWSSSKFATSHYTWGTNGVYMWMQDGGCKVYMDSYMASNGSCFMAIWTIFKNRLLKVGLT